LSPSIGKRDLRFFCFLDNQVKEPDGRPPSVLRPPSSTPDTSSLEESIFPSVVWNDFRSGTDRLEWLADSFCLWLSRRAPASFPNSLNGSFCVLRLGNLSFFFSDSDLRGDNCLSVCSLLRTSAPCSSVEGLDLLKGNSLDRFRVRVGRFDSTSSVGAVVMMAGAVNKLVSANSIKSISQWKLTCGHGRDWGYIMVFLLRL
jgi:hypothetical protein